jgi:hypothetical protein
MITKNELNKLLPKKEAEGTKQQKEEKSKKPKPEEHEGMPLRQYCPRAKRRGDRNPKYHDDIA